MTASKDAVETVRLRSLNRGAHPPGGARQHGQSAVFVLLFLGILLISLNYLYKQGRITSDKMEMQNAADAIAYSISLTEARDLNFAAYMNRAMIANEVAIGQLSPWTNEGAPGYLAPGGSFEDTCLMRHTTGTDSWRRYMPIVSQAIIRMQTPPIYDPLTP